MTDLAKRIARLSPEQRVQLERLLNQQMPAMPPSPITARAGETRQLPLSFEQQRLWFVDQLAPGNPAYNSPIAVRLRGVLDVNALRQSLNEIIRRHEVLRTAFPSQDGQPIQIVNPPFDVPLSLRDLSDLSEDEREAAAYQLACEEAQQPFDLGQGPIFRTQLVRFSPDDHLFLLTFHHIAIDAWSVGIFFHELATLHDAYRRGQPSPLPTLPIQYADYALWQRQTLQGARLESLLAYWRKRLANLPALQLPADHARPTSLVQQGAKCSLLLPQALKEALHTLSKQEQATPFMTLLTAFKTLLFRYSGQEDMVVGTSVAGRTRPEVENLIGFFVNMLVLRTDLSGTPSFREALRRVQANCMQDYAHQQLPFERLVEDIHPERDPTRMPLVQVVFQSVEGPAESSLFPGLTLQPFPVNTSASKFDLLWSIHEHPQGITVEVEYCAALFEAETIKRMLGHYRMLLEGAIAHPDQSIKTLPLLTPEEQHTLLETANQTHVAFPDHLCLHELFEAQVRRQPEATALICQDQRLTYAQLNARANQLAHYLRRLGVGPEVMVGLCVERSIEMVVGILGILKAGGAYAPLDPAYPKERLAFMLAQAAAPVVLTQARLLSGLPDINGQPVCLDADWKAIEQESSDNPASGVTPAHLAYVIFTSGSTGIPKGIAVPHGGVVNNLLDLNRRFAVGPADKVLALSSLSFDMCVYEVLGLLEAGGTIVLPPPAAAKDPAAWADLIVRQRVTIWNSAPALLELLVGYCEQATVAHPLPLRLALLGGDWIPVTLPNRLKSLAPTLEFISLGGATEASIHSIIYPVEETDPGWTSIPYGCPMANQEAYILDSNLLPIPVGVPGELYLGGVGLARGYLHRPDLTAEKFLPHPFSQKPGQRIYKTGDLARYGADGTIELLGRVDFLVKVHGLRIELGEIESTLRLHPALKEAVVLVKNDAAGEKYLVAYVVRRLEAPEPTLAELRMFLSGRLPDYMQPQIVVFLEQLPLSPNGKVDRKSLPLPDLSRRQTEKAFIPPRDALERRLANIWSSFLHLSQIGIDENFFDLGGDSFQAIRVARASSERLAVVDLFRHPTIRKLAAHLRQQTVQSGKLLYELTPPARVAQRSLVCIPYGGGNAISYQPLAKSLLENQRLYAVALPGHDAGRPDEAFLPLAQVANACVEEIIDTITGPLALYGQCAGAALALEIARLLEQKNVPITTLYLGAALPDREPVRSMEFERGISDEEMLEWLRWLGGFEDVLEPETLQQIIQAVRHDLVNAASYYKDVYASQPAKVKTPICCIVGTDDPATKDYQTRFQEWGYLGESIRLVVLQGAGHYFVKHQASELARLLNTI